MPGGQHERGTGVFHDGLDCPRSEIHHHDIVFAEEPSAISLGQNGLAVVYGARSSQRRPLRRGFDHVRLASVDRVESNGTEAPADQGGVVEPTHPLCIARIAEFDDRRTVHVRESSDMLIIVGW